MMKKALILGVSLSLALSLAACSGSNDNTADSTPNTSTPEITQPVDTSTPEVTQPVESNALETAQTTQTTQKTEDPTLVSQVETEQAESSELFTSVNETVYATTTLNVRQSYSTNSDKLGSLAKAQSVTRTGIGQGDAAGWSRIEFNGKVAYVSSDYLSTTKPQVSTGSNSGSSGSQTSKPSSKPSTGGNTSSGGSSSGGGAPAGGGLAGLEDWSNNSGVPSNEYQGGTKDENGNYSDPNLEA